MNSAMLALYVDFNERERLADGGQAVLAADLIPGTIKDLRQGEFDELRAATKRAAMRLIK